ncbi:proteasome subunit beta type-7 [Drosophila sulfurigaster albostrigata]|uniref:proteasome subunit beta type-7 n=1 Tax=Drosophila sulfurigaster albostrigata TaxID=89887 RepID=UPI002D21CB5D|nr:proteasome subunit beta type-7 [Drosophila sulfurigaster albostrigata]
MLSEFPLNNNLDPADVGRGFSFVNSKRNGDLLLKGYKPPQAVRTGTSIVGIIYKDGVILGADTRATEGPIVSDKNCSKIHRLQQHIYCCGAGTAADTEQMTLLTSAEMDLHELNMGRQVPVICASMMLRQTLFRYQGHISAALVLGGVDKYGPHINCIYPCGSIDKIPYAAMGSGTLAAMAVLENGWNASIDLEEGKQLVRKAISAGVFNDLGSGSNIDLCVITAKGAIPLRTETIASERGELLGQYSFLPNTTLVKSVSIQDIEITEERIYRPSRSTSFVETHSESKSLPETSSGSQQRQSADKK